MKITNGVYSINSKDIVTRIKIEKGDIVRGKIVKYNKDSKDAVLKLLNGEEIQVKIQESLNELPENIIKFKVLDTSDNQIKLKITEDKSDMSQTGVLIKNDGERLLKILNRNFPLTKENVEFIDSLEGISKSLKNIEDMDGFVKDLLISKGIDPDSEKGIKVFSQLKGFAAEFKDLTLDDILSLLENNIELTSDNIKSYNRIMKEPCTILKDIELLGKFLGSEEENRIIYSEMKDKIKEAVTDVYDKAKYVMKAAEAMDKGKMQSTVNIFSKNLNDFKVYNSISNNYYYIDVPLKYEGQDYRFKLIIKDDRKSGKMIDKDDVSIAASINTKYMGTIDVFLKIKNSSMNATLKAEKKFVSLLKGASQTLAENLSSNNYDVKINVEEKKQDLDISSYNEFFNDKDFYSLNIYV